MAKTQGDYLKDDRRLMIDSGAAFDMGYLIRQFGCYTTLLIIPITWAAIGALMIWQEWPFVAWPFGAVPLAAWLVLIGLPLFWKMRRAMLKILDAVVKTAEAYLARAGWVIDLNQDGAIGHMRPEIRPPVEEVRPIIYRGRGLIEKHTRGRLAPSATLPDSAGDSVGGGQGLAVAEEIEDRPEIRVKVWHLPNGEKIHQADLVDFIDGIFTAGWNRQIWLDRGMARPIYDGLIMLLEQAQLLTDRKTGYAGRLNVRNARQARAVLDLPLEPSKS